MQQLALGEHAKKSARCPFHEDRHNSFSIWQTPNGSSRWKCHAGCGTGDEITFLEKLKGISNKEATKLFLEMAGVTQASRGQLLGQKTNSEDPTPIDWQRCVDAFNEKYHERLSEWRGYSGAFCSWLCKAALVGLWRTRIAFPVHDRAGKVVAIHYWQKDDQSWRYYPQGAKVRPLVIGELLPAESVHIFESQWDAFAFMDVYGVRSGVIVTRGASNGALVAGLLPESSTAYVWTQNDEAGEKWQKDICANTKTVVQRVKIPELHKDLNDWTRAGATIVALHIALKKSSAGTESSSDDEVIARLAALPTLEYERQRSDEAKRLGCRESALDKLVDAKRPKRNDISLQGSEVNFDDVELWPEAVSGANVLDEIAEKLCRYLVLPTGAADALALWCAHTHAFNAFICSPRLNISSPEKGCGKTTLRDVVALFVQRPLLTENMSVAVLFRLVAEHAPAILADEYDSWLKDNEELRGLLNAGHRRGATALRCEGDGNKVRAFAAYAPAVLCGIGALPGTLHDRAIVIRLHRAKPGEVCARFDPRHTKPEKELCRKLARWCADNCASLEAADPTLPDGVFNRLADNWRPLFAIAEIAGGDWPQRAANALAQLTSREDAEAQSIGVMLLADIQQVLAENDADPFSSSWLVKRLHEMEGRPWAEFGKNEKPLTSTKMSRMLRHFEIIPATKRAGAEVFKGFDRNQFNDAFSRYLACEKVTRLQNA
jgi:hypothetical protein